MRGALGKLPGVVSIDIKAGDEDFTVTYDPAKISPDALLPPLHKAGEKDAKLKS